MQAMMLAAGRGTRLGELGRRVPKALVEIDGRPLLERQLDYLAARGAERVVINAHHLADQIVEFVQRRAHPLEVEVLVEEELLGTAGGVRAALGRFRADQPVVVLCADTLVDAPLEQVLAGHCAGGAEATICVNWLPDTRGKGLVEVDSAGAVTRFIEKPADAPSGLASAGVYVLEPALLELVPGNRFYDFALDLFPRALRAGRRLRAHLLADAAHDIGTPEALALAQGSSTVRNQEVLR